MLNHRSQFVNSQFYAVKILQYLELLPPYYSSHCDVFQFRILSTYPLPILRLARCDPFPAACFVLRIVIRDVQYTNLRYPTE